eukprot:13704627-Alexandrium_andersonii.AAC.1
MGVPVAGGAHRERAEDANVLVRRTFEALAGATAAGADILTEFPEDLGLTPSGHEPASLWQYEELARIAHEAGAIRGALYQCAFGAPCPKPTGLMGALAGLSDMLSAGWPRFDACG